MTKTDMNIAQRILCIHFVSSKLLCKNLLCKVLEYITKFRATVLKKVYSKNIMKTILILVILYLLGRLTRKILEFKWLL